MKKVLKALLAMALVMSLFGCSSSSSGSSKKETSSKVEPLDLTGVWEADVNDEIGFITVITEDMIEVHWLIQDEEWMYWYGSYEAPTSGVDSYKWTSKADEDMTGLLASSDSEKEFSYEDGKLVFVVTVEDQSRTIECEKTMELADYKGAIESAEAEEQAKSDSMAENIEVVKEYTLDSTYASYHFYIIKNNNDFDVSISTDSKSYDANGNLVSVSGGSIDVLAPGCTTILKEYFDTESTLTSYDTKWTVSEPDYYTSIDQSLEVEDTKISDGVIATVTNNGDIDAEFVEVYVLFLANGQLVGYDWGYATDDDSQLKVGEEQSVQLKAYDSFDSYEIYTTGRAY